MTPSVCPCCGERHSRDIHFELIVTRGPESIQGVPEEPETVTHVLSLYEEVTLSVALKIARAVAERGFVHIELADPFRALELKLANDLAQTEGGEK